MKGWEETYNLATMLMGTLTVKSNGFVAFVASHVSLCFAPASNECPYTQAEVIAIQYDVKCSNSWTNISGSSCCVALTYLHSSILHETAWSLILIAHVSSHLNRSVNWRLQPFTAVNNCSGPIPDLFLRTVGPTLGAILIAGSILVLQTWIVIQSIKRKFLSDDRIDRKAAVTLLHTSWLLLACHKSQAPV